MSAVEGSGVFEDLVDVLLEGVDRSRLASFRLSDSKQQRLDELLEKNRAGTLTDRDRLEIATYEQVEHLVRLLKARLFQNDRDS